MAAAWAELSLKVTGSAMATYRQDDWNGLMRATLMGDASAYSRLLTEIQPWLRAYFHKRHMGADSDDLVQMTMLSVHEKKHTFDPKAAFLPWLCAVARNKLIDHVRKYGRHVHIEWDDNLTDTDDQMAPDLAARDLEVLLAKLPPEHAEILRLHRLKELSVEEVARLTGKTPSNIKVIMHRALKRLQAGLGGGDYDG
jgi:RNA polymerase sigma-70 factor, ECF subfamily